MQLSKRLLAIAKEVPSGSKAADVGCDHAYTSIYLAEHQIVEHIVAMDVKKGPLEKAQQNIKNTGFENVIETRLSDGVQALKQGEVNTVIISGMGGSLIIKILTEGVKAIMEVSCLVLQPQTEIPMVRRFLHETGFWIEREKMLIDENKFYTVLTAKRGKPERYNEAEYQFGKCLLECKDETLKAYLEKEEKKMEGILANLYGYREKNEGRIRELEHELGLIKAGLYYFR